MASPVRTSRAVTTNIYISLFSSLHFFLDLSKYSNKKENAKDKQQSDERNGKGIKQDEQMQRSGWNKTLNLNICVWPLRV